MTNMSHPDDKEQNRTVDSTPIVDADPPVGDASRQTSVSGVGQIMRRWKRDDMLKKGSVVLRGAALLFSLLAFVITASNKHGDWKDFDKYEEYRYLLSIAILSTLYTAAQVARHSHEHYTGQRLFDQRITTTVGFVGDQVLSYLLISSASSAVPITNRMREQADNIFTDTSAAAISMAFLAFLTLAFSALFSGYKLSTQSYI
ncbi:hypothetical protein K2173_008487 [Erythroxylum novogranatense]|uniref:CASP-like protein n=1 Tax=Erythroxylum novogranatense TaxID=1862640 RepID=A0AAV8U968_9ROSI|nr:hypothetical protein K2173_008487 [Erythroxylum novogranatense]